MQEDEQVQVFAVQNALQDLFSTPIPGNTVSQLGTVSLVEGLNLRISYAITEGGNVFPWQYHRGGTELAIALEGEGIIEVGNDDHIEQSIPFSAGNVISIPPNILYRVRNRHASRPLKALVCFPAQARSFWPDGTSAEREEEEKDGNA
jgi:quercetin dioxygenase-like cupin family protein